MATRTSPTGEAANSAPPGATIVPGGCGSTLLFKGAAPVWMYNLEFPYVLGTPPMVGGTIFGYPLRAGHPSNPANKILWEVDGPPYGSLDITAHPVGQATPVVSQSVGFLAGGELPSIVDMPQAGCWHFDLAWSGQRAAVELMYQ